MKVTSTSTLGFPRMGPNRELKFALEKYWKGSIDDKTLIQVAVSIEDQAWGLQKAAGLDRITVGDHYLYDGILTWTEYLGAVPARHRTTKPGLTRMFAMARGVHGATALSMKKWITSNYHYMVPEFDGIIDADFASFLANVRRGVDMLGIDCATPVVVGPVTMAYLTKFATFSPGFEAKERRSYLEKLLPIYSKLLADVASIGVTEIQIHEAVLVMEDPSLLELFQLTYPVILPTGPAINMVSFMEDIGDTHYKWLISVKDISIISLDFTRGDNLMFIEKYGFPKGKILGAGMIDSRSVWRVDPVIIKPILDRLKETLKDSAIRIQSSGSLQYIPWDLSCETELLAHPASRVLSFATQKLAEIRAVANASNGDWTSLDGAAWTQYCDAVIHSSNPTVRERTTNLVKSDFCRSEPFEVRRPQQLHNVKVLLPTTSIGSFPQTAEVRRLRSKYTKGLISEHVYNAAIDQQIALAIGIQEGLGLDILVHGEAERTDMVEFFGQQLDGMLLSRNGWVQSFGSRCVRPPVIWADVYRPRPMTVREFEVAQLLTSKPVKGMLTGPVTILNWSFPRSDVSRKQQAMQISLAIQDEISDLEAAGCSVIQVDEPALREAMPMRQAKKQEYLDWAVDSFRLATAKAASSTQIHTHMCYCEFQDCMEAIDKMDTDVNSIENARNDNATLRAFRDLGYTKDLGPGTYDIHSPVVPSVDFIEQKLRSFLECMDVKRLVVNPDCGLKTRTWPETIAALKNMVEATHKVRSSMNLNN